MTPASRHLLGTDLHRLGLEPLPLDPTDVLDGTPSTRSAVLDTVGVAEIGVWEITSGTVEDVEVDEVFVVLSGRAVLEVDDTTIELVPGVAVRLHAGDRTVWTVTETLRKLYVA